MGLLEKIKNALFEEDDDEEEIKEKKETRYKEEKIAKKIDISKTTVELPPKEEIKMPTLDFKTPEKPKGPIIFDDDDLLSDTKELHFKEVPKKEEKILYGGYETKEIDKPKEKFRPSPIISPVYGLVETSSKKESKTSEKKSLDHIFIEERKKEINFDSIRQKAFGGNITTKKEEEPVIIEEKSLLYDMQEENDLPSIGKITLGDAEEYFEDLGLEYEVDYKDEAKQNMTRSKKNQELTEIIEEEIKEDKKIEEEQKEIKQAKKPRATRTKKVEKTIEEEIAPIIEEDYQEPEEKNLYDLIDMMYESKE